MGELEQLLVLFVAAVGTRGCGTPRRGAPYPVARASAGRCSRSFPIAPSPTFPPKLMLALFVAPMLLDAAYDASLRDLRDNWVPVTSLVVVRRRTDDRSRLHSSLTR